MRVDTNIALDLSSGRGITYNKKYQRAVQLFSRRVPLPVWILFFLSLALLITHVIISSVVAAEHVNVMHPLWWGILCDFEVVINCAFFGEVGNRWPVLPIQLRLTFWVMSIASILISICTLMGVIFTLFWSTKIYFIILTIGCVSYINIAIAGVLLFQVYLEYRTKKNISVEFKKHKKTTV
ncbi:MAG: hypothetical protein JSS82_14000 [Bacteroidetes bacterium]|nr:hypothetical protein [Bacteroidota bacterium]